MRYKNISTKEAFYEGEGHLGWYMEVMQNLNGWEINDCELLEFFGIGFANKGR